MDRYDLTDPHYDQSALTLSPDGEWVSYADASKEIAALTAERDEARSLHQELIFQVGKRFRGETRHQTAKRYLQEHEDHCGQGGPSAEAK